MPPKESQIGYYGGALSLMLSLPTSILVSPGTISVLELSLLRFEDIKYSLD
jgi:hypothetical protein